MRHLGEDLIPTDRVAVTELVKNAYDADATRVVLRFSKADSPLGAIEIWDDGHGMSEATVVSNWLEIANPNRVRHPVSASGRRRVLGAKGLGRFAVAKVGLQTSLITRTRDKPEVTLLVDWSAFADDEAFLEDVQVTWECGTAEVFTGQVDEQISQPFSSTHGTLLRIERLQHPWTASDIRELRVALARLLPPPPSAELASPHLPEFAIEIDASDIDPSLSGPVAASETLKHPHYRLFGEIGESGAGVLTFGTDGRPQTEEILIEAVPGGLKCGPLLVDIRVWDLETVKLRDLLRIDVGSRNTHDVRRMIRNNSGVALYRDSFRVQPYGDPEYDWLNLDGRRVNNPTLRLSNNQISGFVYISADENPELRDQSNRLGLINNDAYDSLKQTLLTVIQELELRRYKLRRGEKTPGDRHDAARGIFDAFDLSDLRDVARNRKGSAETFAEAVELAQSNVNEGVEQIQEVLARSSRLATLGSLVDLILHEGRTSLNRIGHELERANRSLRKGTPSGVDQCEAFVSRIMNQAETLDRLFDRIEPLSGRKRGRPKRTSMRKVLQRAIDVVEHDAAARGVRINLRGGAFDVTVDEVDIVQVAVNLLLNASYWATKGNPDGGGLVTIEATHEGESVTLLVSDNGPGVPEADAPAIFDPYFSKRPDGTGLGLTIATSIVQDFYDGVLGVVSPGTLGGATFKVSLRRRIA